MSVDFRSLIRNILHHTAGLCLLQSWVNITTLKIREDGSSLGNDSTSLMTRFSLDDLALNILFVKTYWK